MCSQDVSSIHHNVKDNSCILQCNKKLQLLIPPLYCRDINKGVISALNKVTEGYCKELGGLVIGYKNVQVVQGTGWIYSTNPFIHIHIKATFDVFIPTKGFCIEGVVNEVSNKKVSFLAYNKFNVVYRTHDVRHKLVRASEQNGPNAATCHAALDHLQRLTPTLKEGDTCTLLLHEVSFRDFLPHLRGYPVPKDLDTSSLLSNDIEIPSVICAPPASDTSVSRKVRFSDQESESSDLADISVRDIHILTPPMSHGGRTSDSDDDSVPSGTVDSPDSKKRKKRHAQRTNTDVKQEKLSPPKPLGLPDIGLRSERLRGESSDDAASLLLQSKKKKKRRSNADANRGNDDGPVNVRALQRMIESCMLPEPMADDSQHFATEDMMVVKQEILDVAEGGSTKGKRQKRRKDGHVPVVDVMEANVDVIDNDAAVRKKKNNKKSIQPENDASSLGVVSSERSSRKRKKGDHSEQIDSVEVLKPSKKKRKLNVES